MQQLTAAQPPAEVLKAASREFRRLQRSTDQHPNFAASYAFLETLADLPWNTWSGGRTPPISPAQPSHGSPASQPVDGAGQAASGAEPARSSAADVSHSSRTSMGPSVQSSEPSTSGAHPLQASQPAYGEKRSGNASGTSTSRPHAQPGRAMRPEPSLAAVRAQLDEAHFGLDKVKERIVQVLYTDRLDFPDVKQQSTLPALCEVEGFIEAALWQSTVCMQANVVFPCACSMWRCGACEVGTRVPRSCASSGRRASAKHRWDARSRTCWPAPSTASRWAACATRQRSGYLIISRCFSNIDGGFCHCLVLLGRL